MVPSAQVEVVLMFKHEGRVPMLNAASILACGVVASIFVSEAQAFPVAPAPRALSAPFFKQLWAIP
jgi:hypothetical protein